MKRIAAYKKESQAKAAEAAKVFLCVKEEDYKVIATVLVSLLFTLICLYPTFVTGEESETVSVSVQNFARVSGKTVTIGDIAEIRGPSATVKRVAPVKVTDSPVAGKQKRIPGSVVESRIKSLFPNKNEAPSVTVPGIVTVERAGQEITEAELKALFYSHIEKKSDGRAFRLKDVKIRGNRIVPLGSKVLTIDDKTASVPKGRVALTIRTSVDDEKSSTIFLSGWVDLYDDVVCAGKDIPRGRQIGKDDISLTPRNIASAPPGLMTSADKVEGTVAKARIGRGAVIRDSMIEAAPAVRKGDVVKIIAKTGLLTVVAQGISKGEGRVGDQVMVENIRSGKNIPARVAGPGAVEAIF